MSIRGRKCADGTISYKVRFAWQGREVWEHAGKNRRDAERLEARRRKEVADGTYVPPAQSKATTVGEHLRSWIEIRDNRNADTECGYVRRYVFTCEWFMEMPIMDVRPRHIIALVDELRKQVSAKTGKVLAGKTVANIYGVLRTVLSLSLNNPNLFLFAHAP